jgi:hypothetical protein
VPPKKIDSPAPSQALQRRLKSLPAAPLVILDENPIWLTLLKQGERSIPWALLQMDPQSDWSERLQQHPQLRAGGWLWSPTRQTRPGPAGLPPGWRSLQPPWAWLARWLLKELPLKGRHVGLLAPADCALENLVAWLPRQGASISWCDDNCRHLGSQLRLSDLVVVFPGFQQTLEAHQLTVGTALLDLRPDSQGLAGSALHTTLSAFGDASTGALEALLASLVLAQQETLIELA